MPMHKEHKMPKGMPPKGMPPKGMPPKGMPPKGMPVLPKKSAKGGR